MRLCVVAEVYNKGPFRLNASGSASVKTDHIDFEVCHTHQAAAAAALLETVILYWG